MRALYYGVPIDTTPPALLGRGALAHARTGSAATSSGSGTDAGSTVAAGAEPAVESAE